MKIEQVNKATSQEKEILNIAIEELCEVAQSMTKILRFGWDSTHPDFPKGQTNKQHLEEEIGDLFCLLMMLGKLEKLDVTSVIDASISKVEKLKKFSNIDVDLLDSL